MSKRIEQAVDNKRSGRCNCAQAVAMAYADIIGLDLDTVEALASAYGTGFGTMDGTCGALVGAGMIIGGAKRDRMASRAVLARIMKEFKAQAGSTVCRTLKGLDTGSALLPCNDCVALAATLLERELPGTDAVE